MFQLMNTKKENISFEKCAISIIRFMLATHWDYSGTKKVLCTSLGCYKVSTTLFLKRLSFFQSSSS